MKNDTREENEQSASSLRTVNQILTGDALTMLKKLPDDIVQSCITSPPYYSLRDYGVEGQIGLEESPEAYVEKLVQVFREVRRVLRDDGTLWVNLGDTYANDTKWGGSTGGKHVQALHGDNPMRHRQHTGLGSKQLLGIPWRVAFALQADGWILRSDIIWNKVNPMPESVTDRPTKSHEYLFLLAKSERYYYDNEAIKEPGQEWTGQAGTFARTNGKATHLTIPGQSRVSHREERTDRVPTGRNKRSVWSIPTSPFPESHFAVFPPKLIEPCILAGTSPRACEHCGSPWKRVTEQEFVPSSRNSEVLKGGVKGLDTSNRWAEYPRGITHMATVGWEPTCTCSNAIGSGKGIILDPFMGAGTTALVAIQHGRNYLGIELNPAYVALAEKRITHVQQNLWSTASFDEVAV